MLVLGVDVGTQGVRALAAQPDGVVVAQARSSFPASGDDVSEPGAHEQDPEMWWAGVVECLRAVTGSLGPRVGEIRAIAFSATSGTVCALDGAGRPLRPAIMYDDARALMEAAEVAEAAASLADALGYRFNASFALPKLLWLSRREPGAFAAARYLAHAGDFLVGRLTGEHGVTDETQALKTGYDLLRREWPAVIEGRLGISLAKLPRVTRAGAPVGTVTPDAAAQTGLPAGVTVVAGMTDGCAGQIAAGSAAPGEWVSILGTTLIVKGVSDTLVRDPQGRIYSHRHPDGFWLPGAASNAGGGALTRRFPGADLAALDQQASALTPTGLLIYPLAARGERFPFVRPDAEPFIVGEAQNEAALFTAYLEGVAYTERLGYETLAALGLPIASTIATCGGATSSAVWLQIRADTLGRTLAVAEHPEPAFGAATLAASSAVGMSVTDATHAMARVRLRVEPRREQSARYDDIYQRFVATCRQWGWLE